jgi:protein-tyrosine phosphatase
MQAELYEITHSPVGRVAIMPRPRGGEWLQRELASLMARGVTDLVSMLTPEEEVFLNLQAEAKICSELGITFHRHPVTDHGLPVQPAFDAFIDTLVPLLERNRFIAIHCLAGIGRSAVTAAALLCRFGVSGTEAITEISHARGFDVPETEEQIAFIFDLGRSAG